MQETNTIAAIAEAAPALRGGCSQADHIRCGSNISSSHTSDGKLENISTPRRNSSVELQSETLEILANQANAFAAMDVHPQASELMGFHFAVSGMHNVAAAARQCALAGLTREQMCPALLKLQKVCSKSPFTRHITEWPRGYMGDFEVITQICEQRNRAERGTLAFWIEEYSLVAGSAQQHRNKVARQAAEIVRCAREKAAAGSEARIAVIASGASPDLQLVQNELSALPVRLVLVDSDSDALEASKRRLPALAGKLDVICGNVLTKVRKLSQHGPFDLVVAGGLFDYLEDQVAHFLIRAVCSRVLSSCGTFFFTNLCPDNPFDDWTQYVANWKIIARDEQSMSKLLHDSAAVSNDDVVFERDRTGLALLVTIKRSPVKE